MKPRLLVLNVYFAPHSFGGATIVAEEVVQELVDKHGWDVLVVTTIQDPTIPPCTLRRYQCKGINVVGVNIPGNVSYREQYDNQNVTDVICTIVDLFQPHAVHAHSIQTMGCGYFDYIKGKNIFLVVTLHDCWWLCERQFMIAEDGRYCFQKTIDLTRCQYCVDDINRLRQRDQYLRQQLSKADLLLSPSEFHRQLYIANGLDENKCIVNKNGIRLPRKDYQKKPKNHGKVIFGFTGGPGPVKGADLIIKAFNEIELTNYELLVVDAAQNAGTTWKDTNYWQIPGKVKFVPPYSQGTIDEFFVTIDVLLFPSQWKESFGLTVREALARDVWVIATDAGGVVEDLSPEVNSTIIPLDGHHGALKDAILRCLKSDEWSGYRNDLRKNIRGYKEQATELSDLLMTLVSGSLNGRVIHLVK